MRPPGKSFFFFSCLLEEQRLRRIVKGWQEERRADIKNGALIVQRPNVIVPSCVPLREAAERAVAKSLASCAPRESSIRPGTTTH